MTTNDPRDPIAPAATPAPTPKPSPTQGFYQPQLQTEYETGKGCLIYSIVVLIGIALIVALVLIFGEHTA